MNTVTGWFFLGCSTFLTFTGGDKGTVWSCLILAAIFLTKEK